MNSFQSTSDKASITLSLLCACHCLFLPSLLLVFPSLVAMPMGDETFHVWMLAAVVPFSLFALYRGYKTHNAKMIPMIGLFGLLVLVLTAIFGHDLFSETFEKVFTLIGTLIVAGSHFANYRKCHCKSSVGCSAN